MLRKLTLGVLLASASMPSIAAGTDVTLLNVSYEPTHVQGDRVFIRPRRFELFPNRIH